VARGVLASASERVTSSKSYCCLRPARPLPAQSIWCFAIPLRSVVCDTLG
jgi:hypothetical protein